MARDSARRPMGGNPTLSASRFEGLTGEGVMTIAGTAWRAFILVALVMASAGYTWWSVATGVAQNPMTLLWVGLIGGLVLAMVTIFRPHLAPWTSPLYAVVEGLALGAISVLMDQLHPGLPTQAVLITFGVFLTMLALYTFRIITVTARFRSIIISAMVGVLVFYVLTMVLSFLGVDMTLVRGKGLPSVGISLVIAGIASFSLLLDFHAIEEGARLKAPRYMSWYGAFGLVVGLVWVYIEILNLLRKLRD